jgi:hypothetical protein
MADISQATITLTLTVEQVNGLLGILGNAPFVQSANIINEIQKQGAPQVKNLQDAADAQEASNAATPVTDAPAA